MKRFILLALCVSICFCFCACDQSSETNKNKEYDESIEINEDNFKKYFLVSWHFEKPTYIEPDFLQFGRLKAEFHVDISPKSRIEANDVNVEMKITILDRDHWGEHTIDESLTLRYDGEGSFWVPIEETSHIDYTSYLPDDSDIIIEITKASGEIVR